MNPLLLIIRTRDKAAVQRLLDQGADPYEDRPWALAKRLGLDEIASILPVTFDQDILIALLNKFGYKKGFVDKIFGIFGDKGICLGFSHMVKHMIHSRQIDKFNTDLINLVSLCFEKKHAVLEDLDTNYDVRALLDNIYLYQYHPNFSGIYPHFNFNFNTAAAQDTLELLAPDTTIEYRGQFTGAYDVDELKTYLDLIVKHINQNQVRSPVSMVLQNHHAITIGYDPLDRVWIFADTKNLPVQKLQDSTKMAEKIFASLSYAFKTILFANVSDKEKVDGFLTSLTQDDAWNELHEVTHEKIKHSKWEKIAYGRELKDIQKMNIKSNKLLRTFELPVKFFYNYTSFLADKTKGKYYKEKDTLTYQEQRLKI